MWYGYLGRESRRKYDVIRELLLGIRWAPGGACEGIGGGGGSGGGRMRKGV